MQNQYKYVDHAPLFGTRQRILGSIGQLMNGNPSSTLRIIAVLGSRGKTQTITLLGRLCHKWHRSVALLSSEEAVIMVQGVIVYRKSIKNFEELSGLFIQRFLHKAKKNAVKDVFLEVTNFHLLHHTYTGVEFDGGLVTYGSIQETPSPQEEEWYFITKEFFLDRLAYFQRKPGIEKIIYLNRDDFFYPEFDGIVADQILTYGVSSKATLSVTKWKKEGPMATAELRVPNAILPLRTNRSDIFSLYAICATLIYLLSEGAVNERMTKDIAFAVPSSPFGELLHVTDVPLADSAGIVEEYFSPKSQQRFLIVLLEKTTAQDLFALQSFLKQGGRVLLWQKRRKVAKELAHLVVDMAEEFANLTVFSRPPELVLEAKLLMQSSEGVVLAESDHVLEHFAALAAKKDW